MSNILRFRLIAVLLIFTATIAVAQESSAQTQAAAEQRSLSGTVKCAAQAAGHYTCGRNQTLLTCTLACVARGSNFVLQTRDKTYFLAGDERQLEQFAGGKAVLTGHIVGSTFFAVNTGSDHVVDTSSPAMAGK
ncbi:MAG: hypothetical protein ABSD96_19850 [Candidatus Korobacteraceae bacterium]|jgi:hypothetical protein